MKLILFIPIVILAIACGNKTTRSVTDNKKTVECKDTISEITFINSKSIEVRISLSSKTSKKEGNTIVNSWKSFQTTAIPAGDSIQRHLKTGEQFMLTVYGPVSTNVNGLGVIAEEKFTLLPCEKRRKLL